MVKHFVRQPLSTSFMLVSMLGILFSTFVVWGKNMTWGFTLTLLFTIWFLASVYNFTHLEDETVLDIHGSESKVKLRAKR